MVVYNEGAWERGLDDGTMVSQRSVDRGRARTSAKALRQGWSRLSIISLSVEGEERVGAGSQAGAEFPRVQGCGRVRAGSDLTHFA